MQKDWLGNDLVEGDLVLYTSKSTHTGMNLGELITLSPQKIQVRIPARLWDSEERKFMPGFQIVTLQKHTGAYRSVTKYFGPEVDLLSLVR